MKPLKPGDKVIFVGLNAPIIGIGTIEKELPDAPRPSSSKSASAHLATDPQFGAAYDAIFGKKHRGRTITRAEAEMN